jgi:glycosyltransferase involved in cell wall biosynthesis
VVDDCSVDGGGARASAAGAHVITHSANRGKGRALVSGFRYALEQRYDAVVTMDGDGQHDPGDLSRLLAAGDSADLVVGTRMGNASGMPFVRWVTNRVMSAILSRFCRVRIPDSQCGYRLIRCDLLRRLRFASSGYDSESEILIRAARVGARIASVPIRVIYGDQRSYIRPLRDTVRFLRLLWSLRRSQSQEIAARGETIG